MAKYSIEFKMLVLDEVGRSKISERQIAKKYGISRNTLGSWKIKRHNGSKDGLGSRSHNMFSDAQKKLIVDETYDLKLSKEPLI